MWSLHNFARAVADRFAQPLHGTSRARGGLEVDGKQKDSLLWDGVVDEILADLRRVAREAEKHRIIPERLEYVSNTESRQNCGCFDESSCTFKALPKLVEAVRS